MMEPDAVSSLESLQAAYATNPNDISVLSRLAQMQASLGDYNSACDLYEKLVGMDAENGLAWMALGHCYLLRGEYQKCFQAYQKALSTLQDRKNAQLWYGIALMYTKLETYDQAESAYQTVLRIEPDFEQKGEVLFKLGQVYYKTAQFANAVSSFTSSIAENSLLPSRRVEAFCQLGVCYEKTGEIAKALDSYRKAIEVEPENYKPWEYLGWAMVKNGQDGSSELRTAVTHVGDNTAEEGDLHYLLGRAALERKQYVESKEEFQLAILKNPQSALYWCSIGVLYALAMQPQDAFESLVKASNLPGAGVEVWLDMGILYEHCKQKNEAILAYDRVLSHQPGNATALERKAALGSNLQTTTLPDFVHPTVEIEEGPFSMIKETKTAKQTLPQLIESEEGQEMNGDNETCDLPSEPVKRKRPVEQRAAPKPPVRTPAPPPVTTVPRPQPTSPPPMTHPSPFGVMPYYSPYVMPPNAAPSYMPYPGYYGQVMYPQYMVPQYYAPPPYYQVPQPVPDPVAPMPQEPEPPMPESPPSKEESSGEEYQAEEEESEEEEEEEEEEFVLKRRRVHKR